MGAPPPGPARRRRVCARPPAPSSGSQSAPRGEVGDQLRRRGVEAQDVEHPAICRVGDREAVHDHADHHQPCVDVRRPAVVTQSLDGVDGARAPRAGVEPAGFRLTVGNRIRAGPQQGSYSRADGIRTRGLELMRLARTAAPLPRSVDQLAITVRDDERGVHATRPPFDPGSRSVSYVEERWSLMLTVTSANTSRGNCSLISGALAERHGRTFLSQTGPRIQLVLFKLSITWGCHLSSGTKKGDPSGSPSLSAGMNARPSAHTP